MRGTSVTWRVNTEHEKAKRCQRTAILQAPSTLRPYGELHSRRIRPIERIQIDYDPRSKKKRKGKRQRGLNGNVRRLDGR